MKVIKINSLKPDKEPIQKAAQVIKIGGLVVYPTETLYGLGADPFNQQAMQRLYDVKGRDPSKPVSLAFRNVTHAKKFAEFNDVAENLAKKFLPGPLTMILKAKEEVAQLLGIEKIGVRIPLSKIALALLNEIKIPITATSANLSGGPNPIDSRIAIEQIGDKVDLVLDAGKCEYGMPSTVIDVSEGEIKILREGAIPKKDLI